MPNIRITPPSPVKAKLSICGLLFEVDWQE